MFYLSDMDDLGMTCGDFVHALKMLICSEKHPVSRANQSYQKSGNSLRTNYMRLYLQHNSL